MSGAGAIGLLLLGGLLAVNARATRRVLASDLDGMRKKLFVTGVWLVPLFGALMVKDVGRPASVAPQEEQEDAPAHITLPDGRVLALPLYRGHGLPLLDWEAAAAARGGPLDAGVRDALRRAWLLHLRDALGEGFRLRESQDALVLSSLDKVTAEALLRYVAATRQRVARVLQDVAAFAPGEKSVVLVVDGEDTYYQYVSNYFPDGEFGFSGGMFLGGPCPHFVVKSAELRSIEPVIAHELTHSALAHLGLPRWLDEGLAVNTERRLAGSTPNHHTAQQLHGKHVAFWDADSIQQFWSGDAFFRTDDGQMLSYELARILVQEMSRDWPAFAAFAREASAQDAGHGAAQRLLGLNLAHAVCALFGKTPDSDWEPAPGRWQATTP